ncbi:MULTISPECIES: hypothetical protein [unclassified Streptomyces]|uniref:hypothetical protein n=1 Tax=unclassified Streptomyces TaxID=2593676 RepID=UPI003400AB4E
MADEPDTTTLKDQYAARVTADLEANQQDQSRIRAELDALKGRLEALERDHGLLQTMHHTLTGAAAAAGRTATAVQRTPAKNATPKADTPKAGKADTAKVVTAKTATTKTATSKSASGKSVKTAAPAKVPTPRSKKTEVTSEVTATVKSPAKSAVKSAAKPARTLRKNTAPAKTASRGKAETSGPTLREVVLGLFAGHQEPRTVADILTELTTAHPDRATSPQVVRNTLEALVAKGELERERKQGSVFYTAPDKGTTGTAGTPTADAVPVKA